MAERSAEIVEGCLDQVILDSVDSDHVQESKDEIDKGLFLTPNQNSTSDIEGTQPDLSNCHSKSGTLDSETILINYASRKQKLNENEKEPYENESTREDLPKSVTFPEELNKLKTTSEPSKNGRPRSSLAEDSRLVKISLATNPINLMHTNAQFLNKSRNFLNFITEKSTNIMEKTLLPQHIANKYSALNRNAEPNSKESPKTSLPNSPSKTVIITTETDCKEKNVDVKEKTEDCEDPSKAEESKTEDVILDGPNSPLRNSIFSSNGDVQILEDFSPEELNAKFLERIRQLEEKNQMLEIEKNELVETKVKSLERTIEKLGSELKNSLEKQEAMSKEVAAVNKDRESMVMKYATGEKQLINAQRSRDAADRKVKELSKENELLQTKLRQMQNERTRICTILDSKCNELVEQQKLAEKFKEEVNMKDVKLTWVQNKWKTEMEVHKETQQKLDKVNAKINEMKEECELVKRESQESIRKFQVSEENKAVTLDHQLKEQQARLILERHVTEDKELLRMQLQKEVDTLKSRQEVLVEENNVLSLKIQELEKDKLNYDSSFSTLKTLADQRQKEINDLVAKVSEMETLKLQLKHLEQNLSSTESEIERLRQSNEELEIDMDACRQREAQMLEFTQKLTDKNVRLQSEFSSLESKTQRLERDQKPIREQVVELLEKVKCLEESLVEEQKKRTEDCEILAKHVAEQTQLAAKLKQQLEDSQGENAVLKRKHQLSLKEMTRELHQYRKRLEAFETSSPSNSLDPLSRTGSNASLNAADASNGASSDASNYGDNPIQTVEPDHQALMDRIIKLQKINVKRAEKLDFLDEHCCTLMAELQKKTKIIQNYILHEDFDAMGSNARDKHKAELARHGGIMASVYNHKVSDENMTLELSLEINQKLQTVLEDTLLKNITLKDNIDTLGEEIARLTMQNQQKKK